jgi:hypothetical protein
MRKHKERLYCHNCDSHQVFEWDLELDGNQVFYCPQCNHPHYRVMEEDTRIRIYKLPPIQWGRTSEEDLSKPVPLECSFGNAPSQKRWASANR